MTLSTITFNYYLTLAATGMNSLTVDLQFQLDECLIFRVYQLRVSSPEPIKRDVERYKSDVYKLI